MTHEVHVLCGCDDIEACVMELYVSDVRILQAELERVRADAERVLTGA